MAIHSFLQLFVLILIEGQLLSMRVVISGDEVLALHEGLLLHLVYLQLFQRNIHTFTLQLSS
jgi:hypothetical protein